MSLSQSCVSKLYSTVIDDVITGVREFFLDEGVDEQVLLELKNNWETRLQATKAIECKPEPEPQPPVLKQNLINKTVPMNHLVAPTTIAPTAPPPAPAPAPVDFGKTVSIQITLPAQQGVQGGEPRSLTITVPAAALEGNHLQTVLTGPVISATMALPLNLAAALLQQHVTASLQAGIQLQNPGQQTQQANINNSVSSTSQGFQTTSGSIAQLDGVNDTSDDDDEEDDEEDEVEDDEDDDAEDKDEEDNEENEGAEEEPLNSEDDVSEEDPLELFETDNVVVCQYDKITRTRNKWKFYFKDGIMNLGGKDFVFQKSNGDAEW